MSEKRKEESDSWRNYMVRKMTKLNDQNDECRTTGDISVPDSSTLFENISIYVNGLTEPSSDELKRMIMTHGGKYDYYYSKTRTTYVIANNLAFGKMSRLGSKDRIVKPQWVVDCIKEIKLLPVTNYLVYEPGLVSGQQKLAGFADFSGKSVDVEKSNVTDFISALESERSDAESLDALGDEVENDLDSLDDPVTGDIEFEEEPVTDVQSTNAAVSSLESRHLKAGDPGFINAYFNKSRLHHISSSGTSFKRYVEELRTTDAKIYEGRKRLREMLQRDKNDSLKSTVIMHVDMDCFFVSVGLLTRPDLIGQPVAVCHAKSGTGPANSMVNSNENERGKAQEFNSFSEIACASYEARSFGIKNGSRLGSAMQKCPELKAIPYNFDEYSRISKLLYDTVATYSVDIEAMSCDELYVDITEVLSETGATVEEFAAVIRKEIQEKTGCSASAGFASNVLLAKMASKKAKQNGHYTMSDDYDTIIDMISQLSVRDLPGVGYATGDKLKELLEVETCADLMKISLPRLQELFGAKTGQNLHDACRGIDRDKLKFDQATSRKSLSVDVNYGIRFTEQTEVEKFVYEIADEVSRRLKEISAKCSSLTLKLRIRSKDAPIVPNKFLGTGLCDHTSRSTVLRTRTDDSKVIGASCVTMLRTMKFLVCDLRGIGIGMSKLSYETLSPQKMMLEDYFKSNQSLQKDNPGVRSTQAAVINGSAVSSMFNNNEPAISHAGHSSHHSSMAVSRETIDESVLNELPEELRQEIMKSYGITKESKVTSNTGKRKKAKTSEKQSKANSSKSAKAADGKPVIGPLDKMFDMIKNSERVSMECTSVPHICGETEINSVKDILKEWIQTEPELLDEDVAYVSNYFLNLVSHRDWLKLIDVFKCLYELVLTRDETLWTETYNSLVALVRSDLENTSDIPAELINKFNPIERIC